MSRVIFLNGQCMPAAEATVSVMDRGFIFADGIYEVTAVACGKLVDNDAHLARLTRSLSEIGIDNPYIDAEWTRVCEELVARDGLDEGVVYMQVMRGVAERDFDIPANISPTVVVFTQVKFIVDSPLAKKGAAAATVPDLRWKHCDIKSVGLLPQVVVKQIAVRAGAHEAWMTDGDHAAESASSTAFIITVDKRLITCPLSNAVLPGITRVSILALTREHDLTLEECAFTVAEAQQAAEAFCTSASTFVMPVVPIDSVQIGSGQPGPLTQALRTLYPRFAGVDVAELVDQMRRKRLRRRGRITRSVFCSKARHPMKTGGWRWQSAIAATVLVAAQWAAMPVPTQTISASAAASTGVVQAVSADAAPALESSSTDSRWRRFGNINGIVSYIDRQSVKP